MKKLIYIPLILLLAVGACKNQDWDFPDYDYQTVYFAYQYPVRTITLGDDIFDNSLDNAHKCKIYASTGGVYVANLNVVVDVEVDNSMCQGLLFGAGAGDVVPMPDTYYRLTSNQITIPKGELAGGVEVELTDAFFADPLSFKNNYVIPLKMVKVANADSILSGTPQVPNPRRGVSGDWSVAPKDFVFYAVKYINTWHGSYLRRGKDVVTGNNGNTVLDQTIVRHQQYVEKDEVCNLVTASLEKAEFPVTIKGTDGKNIVCNLILTFDAAGNCTVTDNSDTFSANGSGKFVKKGEKNSWGNADRDALYLSYNIEFAERQFATTDTLVMRSRGVVPEIFTPVLKN